MLFAMYVSSSERISDSQFSQQSILTNLQKPPILKIGGFLSLKIIPITTINQIAKSSPHTQA